MSFPQRSAAPQLREQLALCEGYGCDTCSQCVPPKGFTDSLCLLAECEKRKLEAPCRSGDHTGRIKVKSQSWREANKDRWRHFEESRRAAQQIALSILSNILTVYVEVAPNRSIAVRQEEDEDEPGFTVGTNGPELQIFIPRRALDPHGDGVH